MTTSTRPQGVADWQQFLAAQQLPSLFNVRKRVMHHLSDPELSYDTLATLCGRDPVLSMHILRTALGGQTASGVPVKTLQHGISLIGVKRLGALVRDLPKPTDKRPGSVTLLSQAMVSSLLAAHIARAWSARRFPANADNAYWAALFYGVPYWHLCYYAPDCLREISHLQKTRFVTVETAQQQVLGCSYAALAQPLMRLFNAPDLTLTALEPQFQPSRRQLVRISQHISVQGNPVQLDDRALRHLCQQVPLLIYLANHLAQVVSHSWYDRAALRYLKAAAVCLNGNVGEVAALAHEQAVVVSRQYPIPGVVPPGVRVLWPKIRRKTRLDALLEASKTSGQTAPKAASPTPAAATPEAPTGALARAKPAPHMTHAQRLLQDMITRMFRDPASFSDSGDILHATAETAVEGLNLRRVSVARYDDKVAWLSAKCVAGDVEDGEPLTRFRLKLDKDSLFTRLASKPSSVWMRPQSKSTTWALVPTEFQLMNGGTKEFLLMSVFNQAKPIAVVYADNGPDGNALNKNQYDGFKTLCNAASFAIMSKAAE